MVGDGPLAPDVAVAAAALPGRIRLTGRLEGADLAAEYARSDVLVVPSRREVWGLVVNEALAAGMHVIATDEVGSAHDLLDADSGQIIRDASVSGLAQAMERAIDSWDGSSSARDRRQARVAGCTPSAFARDIHRAVVIAVGGRDRGALKA